MWPVRDTATRRVQNRIIYISLKFWEIPEIEKKTFSHHNSCPSEANIFFHKLLLVSLKTTELFWV